MPASAESFNLAWHCLGRQAAVRGGKTALIIADGPDALRSFTYAEIDAMVRRLAGGLIGSGLAKGDRVLIRAANDIDFVPAFFAVTAIGCVAQPASLMLTAEEALALAADFRGEGGLSRRRRPEGARALFPSPGFRPAGDAPARRRCRARRLRSDGGGRPRLSPLHLRLDRRSASACSILSPAARPARSTPYRPS